MLSPSKHAFAEAPEVDAPAVPEERQAYRRSAVWISARLMAGELVIPCDILNVSAGGVRIRTTRPCESNAPVNLEVDGLAGIAVSEAWRNDDLTGLRFDAPADEINRFVKQLESAEPSIMEQREYQRCSVLWSACVFSAGRTMDAVVLNLSAGGARIRLSGAAVLDDRATVSIGRFGDFAGRLVWRQGDEFGLEFLDPPERIVDKVGEVLPRIRNDFERRHDRPN